MIKKVLFVFTMLLLFSMLTFEVSADGMLKVYFPEDDTWSLFNEESQVSAITYRAGIQNMILSIETEEQLQGEKAVWIFPIPSEPENININILEGFPHQSGDSISTLGKNSLGKIFSVLRLSQVYFIPPSLFLFQNMMGGAMGGLGTGELTVHQQVERMGLTTELISARSSSAIENYANSKNLTLLDESKPIFEEYIGKNYSFVFSWVSDVEEFNKHQNNSFGLHSTLGVFASFPTDRIFYPLKPTSIYGERVIPVTIYLYDFVKGDIYREIEPYTEIEYFYTKYVWFSDELTPFFSGYEIIEEGRSNHLRNVDYTRIKIIPPSNKLLDDLWMDINTPFKVSFTNLFINNALLSGIIIFILISCLASLLAGIIVFRKNKISKMKFIFYGLSNFLTLIGVYILSFSLNIDSKFTNKTELKKEKIPYSKVLLNTSKTAGIIFAISFFLILIMFFLYADVNYADLFIYHLFIALIITLFASLFVYFIILGYYQNKDIIKFVSLFSVLFIVISVLIQILLTNII